MHIGVVTAQGRGATDELLSALVARVESDLRLVGVVQTNTDRPDCVGCDMDVRVLPGQRVLRISQSLGPEATGCRLDTAVLEDAVGLVSAALAEGADLLILNKFGKHEAAGRGFRPVIAAAMEAGIPVLTGVNETNRAAFDAFTGGMAEPLDPTLEMVSAWVSGVVAKAADVPAR